ncbi:MAG: CHAD domain-containing protein [Bacteroidales bacterium]
MESNNNGKNKAIYHFLETQLQLFKGHFLVTQASMDEDAIHQMRVAIKRIRTIQKLKKHINFPTIIDEQQYAAIRQIFSVSGMLRDLQIQTGLLKNYRKELKFSFDDLQDHLNQKEHQLVDQLNRTIQEIDFERFNELPDPEASINDLDKKADLEKQSLDFLKKKIGNIRRLILLLDREEFVHDLRKQVKQLFFILQFLSTNFPESHFGDYRLKPLKDAGESLGDWNDRDVFLNMLNAFLEEKVGDYLFENAEYQILQYVLTDEKQKLLHDLDLKIYMELIDLRVRLGEGAQEDEGEKPAAEADLPRTVAETAAEKQ